VSKEKTLNGTSDYLHQANLETPKNNQSLSFFGWIQIGDLNPREHPLYQVRLIPNTNELPNEIPNTINELVRVTYDN